MKFYNFLGLLILSIVIGTDSYGQKSNLPFGYNFVQKKKKSVSVPFQLKSNLIVVKAFVDGSDTLNFVLDTGVSSVIITDPKVADQINTNFVRTVSIKGAGEDEPLEGEISIGHKVTFGDIVGYQQNLIVLSEDVLHLSEFMGIPIHGIFGYDLFSTFVVAVDYEDKVIEFKDKRRFRFKRKYGKRYPLVVTNSKPYTDAFSITTSDDKEVPVRLVIDTGAGHALLLNTNDKEIPIPDKVVRANLGRGLNGDVTGHIGRISMLKVGDLEVENVIASFPDSISFAMKFPPTDYNRQGSVGCEFLRRFRVTFNYSKGYIALKPNKKRLKQPFEHDMSGITVRASGERFDQYIISQIAPESPAELAGLKIGDELVFLNGKSVLDMTINQIITTLSRKEGMQIDLFFKRQGNLGFVSFDLKRII